MPWREFRKKGDYMGGHPSQGVTGQGQIEHHSPGVPYQKGKEEPTRSLEDCWD